MRTFLGLPLTRSSLSDEQYIEKLRKSQQQSKFAGYMMAGFAILQILCVIGFFVLINRFQEMQNEFANSMEERELIETQMHFGLVAGMTLGFSLAGAISGVIACSLSAYRMLTGKATRTVRLAIEYYDLSLKLIDDDLSSREHTNA
ncbi:hypothetical protein HED60_03360 [Planctomycetales bacterium ZRK34]|nr:hypothetical protein HED60_03360 [Planctomycetales bacterium ZRK34]